MPDASERRTAQAKALRLQRIETATAKFFARYTAAPTRSQVIADAATWKKRLDPFVYKRIIARANKLPTSTAARPAPPPNASIYFDTPGTPGAGTAAAAAPGGNPLPFILGAIALVFLLRR